MRRMLCGQDVPTTQTTALLAEIELAVQLAGVGAPTASTRDTRFEVYMSMIDALHELGGGTIYDFE